MSRSVRALGPDAVRKAIEILASGEIGKSRGGVLESGTQWGGDRMLLSWDCGVVRFVVGATLYEQDHPSFLLAEFPPGGAPPRLATWLRDLSPREAPLFLGLAGELVPLWPGVTAACGFLDRFGYFYRLHRTLIEPAARELRTVAEGLLALQHWPVLFERAMDAMGERAYASLPKALAAADLGAFLGRLLMGSLSGRLTLARIPECLRSMREPPAPQAEECLRIPHYRRMFDQLERSAESAAPAIERLRAAV